MMLLHTVRVGRGGKFGLELEIVGWALDKSTSDLCKTTEGIGDTDVCVISQNFPLQVYTALDDEVSTPN